MNDQYLPEKVWVVVSGKHKQKLHAKEDCANIKPSKTRKVPRKRYPNSEPCQNCTDYGPDPTEKSQRGGESQGYKELLEQADSFDEIREGAI